VTGPSRECDVAGPGVVTGNSLLGNHPLEEFDRLQRYPEQLAGPLGAESAFECALIGLVAGQHESAIPAARSRPERMLLQYRDLCALPCEAEGCRQPGIACPYDDDVWTDRQRRRRNRQWGRRDIPED
jgi:hypothetical protein